MTDYIPKGININFFKEALMGNDVVESKDNVIYEPKDMDTQPNYPKTDTPILPNNNYNICGNVLCNHFECDFKCNLKAML